MNKKTITNTVIFVSAFTFGAVIYKLVTRKRENKKMAEVKDFLNRNYIDIPNMLDKGEDLIDKLEREEEKLGDRLVVEKLINDRQLVLLPLSDIRGYDTTGMNAAIYISEAQNLDIELMRLALQRIGEDSICIIDGDDQAQVDMSLYSGKCNGMKRVSRVFRGADFYGEVTLKNIHRSKIAKLAQKL